MKRRVVSGKPTRIEGSTRKHTSNPQQLKYSSSLDSSINMHGVGPLVHCGRIKERTCRSPASSYLCSREGRKSRQGAREGWMMTSRHGPIRIRGLLERVSRGKNHAFIACGLFAVLCQMKRLDWVRTSLQGYLKLTMLHGEWSALAVVPTVQRPQGDTNQTASRC